LSFLSFFFVYGFAASNVALLVKSVSRKIIPFVFSCSVVKCGFAHLAGGWATFAVLVHVHMESEVPKNWTFLRASITASEESSGTFKYNFNGPL